MITLNNLENMPDVETTALLIENGNEIHTAFHNGCAATAAKTNGAINVWKDMDDVIHCERQKFCVYQDKQTFTNPNEAVSWVCDALLLIE